MARPQPCSRRPASALASLLSPFSSSSSSPHVPSPLSPTPSARALWGRASQQPKANPSSKPSQPGGDAALSAMQPQRLALPPPPLPLSEHEQAALRHATDLIRMLREAGHLALVAGGWVRDRFIGRPAADIDIATSGEVS